MPKKLRQRLRLSEFLLLQFHLRLPLWTTPQFNRRTPSRACEWGGWRATHGQVGRLSARVVIRRQNTARDHPSSCRRHDYVLSVEGTWDMKLTQLQNYVATFVDDNTGTAQTLKLSPEPVPPEG